VTAPTTVSRARAISHSTLSIPFGANAKKME
jgi:hypothetical protein